MGWGGSKAQEGADICILIADSHYLQQKLTQPCKAIILQLKNKLEELHWLYQTAKGINGT